MMIGWFLFIAVLFAAVPAWAQINVWAVGGKTTADESACCGAIVHTSAANGGWSPQLSGTSSYLFGVSFVDVNNGWAAGGLGAIVHTVDGGSTWSPQNSSTGSHLNGIRFVDANNGWAVGFLGAIVHTVNGGDTWSLQSSGTGNPLFAVAFVDTHNGWIVGAGGIILHTTNGGGAWSAQSSGTVAPLLAVSFVDANNGWAAGAGGTLVHTNDGGAHWSAQDSETANSLFGISFVDADHGWAVGESGTILHTANAGNTWSPQAGGAGVGLRAVSFSDAANGWAVGLSGSILLTSDSGSSWAAQNSGTGADLYGISFAAGTSASFSVTKTHTGTFTQGALGEWDITVSSNSISPSGLGSIAVSDTLPGGYIVNSFSTTDASWSCSGTTTQKAVCTSSSVLSGAGSLPPIRIVVNIPTDSAPSVTNTARLATGASGFDTVSVVQVPVSVTAMAGAAQSSNVNSAFSVNFQAKIADAGNMGVPNAVVTFQAPTSSPSGTFAAPCSGTTCIITTNAMGIATAPKFTADSVSGAYNVTATVASLAPAVFRLTNVVAPVFKVSIATQSDTGSMNEWDIARVTFAVSNSNPVTLTGMAFTDILPSGLVIQNPNGLGDTCGGAVLAQPGSSNIVLATGSVGPSSSCAISVDIVAAELGLQTNGSVTLTSTEAPPAQSAAISVSVVYNPLLWFFY